MLNSIKTNNPINKWSEDQIDISPKKTYRLPTKRHMKRCSASLIIREMQIKTTMRYHFTPTRVTFIKTSTNNKRVWREGNPPTLLVGM